MVRLGCNNCYSYVIFVIFILQYIFIREPCMEEKGEGSKNTVSAEEAVKPGTPAGDSLEHKIDDKLIVK